MLSPRRRTWYRLASSPMPTTKVVADADDQEIVPHVIPRWQPDHATPTLDGVVSTASSAAVAFAHGGRAVPTCGMLPRTAAALPAQTGDVRPRTAAAVPRVSAPERGGGCVAGDCIAAVRPARPLAIRSRAAMAVPRVSAPERGGGCVAGDCIAAVRPARPLAIRPRAAAAVSSVSTPERGGGRVAGDCIAAVRAARPLATRAFALPGSTRRRSRPPRPRPQARWRAVGLGVPAAK